MPQRRPRHEVARDLANCAMGHAPADLLIREGQWVCVQTGEIIPHTDIAIKGSRVAYVGPEAGHTLGPDTKVIDAGGPTSSPACSTAACTSRPADFRYKSLKLVRIWRGKALLKHLLLPESPPSPPAYGSSNEGV